MSGSGINTGFNSGFYGMQMASQGMQRAAQQIVSAGVRQTDGATAANVAVTGGADTAEPLISLKMNVNLFNASAKVVETTDQMIGTLIDVRA